MPVAAVRDRTLQATVWACDRLLENTFLGAVTIPLENIFSRELNNFICANSGIKIQQWYLLTNAIQVPSKQARFS